jgi:hypothetical protein
VIKIGIALFIGFLFALGVLAIGILGGTQSDVGYDVGADIGSDVIDAGSGYDTNPTYIGAETAIPIIIDSKVNSL